MSRAMRTCQNQKQIRWLFPRTFVFALLFLLSSDLWAETGERLIEMTDEKQLMERAAAFEKLELGRRACSIQRERQIPPVSCFQFANSAFEIDELERLCLQLSARTMTLPILDAPNVSEACRKAVKNRGLDLMYARQASG